MPFVVKFSSLRIILHINHVVKQNHFGEAGLRFDYIRLDCDPAHTQPSSIPATTLSTDTISSTTTALVTSSATVATWPQKHVGEKFAYSEEKFSITPEKIAYSSQCSTATSSFDDSSTVSSMTPDVYMKNLHIHSPNKFPPLRKNASVEQKYSAR